MTLYDFDEEDLQNIAIAIAAAGAEIVAFGSAEEIAAVLSEDEDEDEDDDKKDDEDNEEES